MPLILATRQQIKVIKEDLKIHEEHGYGHFVDCCSIFCLIDFLGSVVYGGKATSRKALDYMRNYFPSNYGWCSALLYDMYRHGTVHELKPKSYRLGADSLSWCLVVGDSQEFRREHLKVFQGDYDSNKYVIVVNLFQLADDLELSLSNIQQNNQSRDSAVILSSSNDISREFRDAITRRDNRLIDKNGCTHL